MTLAIVFPGQGSQSVGMGKALQENYAASRDVFAEVDDALGENLSRLIFEGPIEELTLTANAQPALMAVSMATMRALESEGFAVSSAAFAAGHSLGEYSALAATGAISIAETAKLLRIRGLAMQEAVPAGEGAMAAILGLEMEAVQALCDESSQGEVCEPANDNGGGQIVISGAKGAVERAVARAGERGAKRAIPLPVSAPFHCALMSPAAERMAQALKDARISVPSIPVITNVTADATQDPEMVRKRLVEQVTGSVRWRESMIFAAEEGVDELAEIGAGKVLSGLAKRIDKRLSARSIGTPDEIAAFLKDRG
ncbi:[acyl-carrier-protein] S-malonyltransferase [Fulvimarina endophytica]|uniref:Malonyl CoA-acyl carrier protein transacylase n=1 Tax=Fulvimarina endophytica TaxID=2293836 RepID=A0A371XAE1_9HYPH|nr:ACP S-malonyltransferase [Fulvimarina endophytica]RFC66195.1 [acyl-carrier-protein] S-malonyltransferase [Fulvimarina endophytica]